MEEIVCIQLRHDHALLQVRSLTEKLREAQSRHSSEVAVVLSKYNALRDQVADYHNHLFVVMDAIEA